MQEGVVTYEESSDPTRKVYGLRCPLQPDMTATLPCLESLVLDLVAIVCVFLAGCTLPVAMSRIMAFPFMMKSGVDGDPVAAHIITGAGAGTLGARVLDLLRTGKSPASTFSVSSSSSSRPRFCAALEGTTYCPLMNKGRVTGSAPSGVGSSGCGRL